MQGLLWLWDALLQVQSLENKCSILFVVGDKAEVAPARQRTWRQDDLGSFSVIRTLLHAVVYLVQRELWQGQVGAD